jgi:multidrug efflux system membrane fusion protein
MTHRAALRKSFPGAVGFLVVLLATGCGQAPPPQAKKATEIIATTPITAQVVDYQDFTGRMDAIKTVDIRPRVSGYIMDAPFKEGDLVHEGDLLFQIDDRLYKADFNQAEANLKQAEAERKLQQKNVERGRHLFTSHSIGKEELDQILAAYEKAGATVGAMEAARDRARINLEYTRVTAPLAGRISRRNVDPGNLVNADSSLLTTVVTIKPVYAYFDVDERSYLELVKESQQSTTWFSEMKFPVLMKLANEEEFTWTGNVNFLDNRVNANTGTIRMRAVFQETKGFLKSGLFARIRLPLGGPKQELLIPDEAILSDQGRKYVYVVTKDNKVEYRSVMLGQAIHNLRVVKHYEEKLNDKGEAASREGLKPGERVVVSGMQRVRPNQEVRVKMQDPPKAPDSPLVKLLARGEKDELTTESQRARR